MKLDLAGLTQRNTRWELKTIETVHTYTLFAKDGELKERVSVKLARRFSSDYLKARAFLSAYAELLEAKPTVDVRLAEFNGFPSIGQEILTAAVGKPANVGLYLLRAAAQEPAESLPVLERLAEVSALSSFSNGSNFSLPAFQKVEGVGLSTHLDFIDFLINGDGHENFHNFREEFSGRVFPTYRSSQWKFGGDESVSLRDVYLVGHRFLQLSRRSQKLKKTLESLSRNEVINALSFEIPGTLLVNDTLELIKTLKTAERNTVRNSENENYTTGHVYTVYGKTVSNLLEKENFLEDFAIAAQKHYLTDSGHNVPFAAHSVIALGGEKTLRLLKELTEMTEGVSQRGFMELVRRGGFQKGEQPSWVACIVG